MAETTGDVEQSRPTRLAEFISLTRFTVLAPIAAVLAASVTLFVLAAALAVVSIWDSGEAVLNGDIRRVNFVLKFLKVVSLTLEAVVFYLVGTGLYALFIGPLAALKPLKADSLRDLEAKVVNVVIVILVVTFLERFVAGDEPDAVLRYGAAVGAVVAALVAFQLYLLRTAKEPEVR